MSNTTKVTNRIPNKLMTAMFLAFLASSSLLPSQAQGQDAGGQDALPGETRINGELQNYDSSDYFNEDAMGSLINFREELRRFIQSITTYARSQKPDFIVLARGGLDLMVKRGTTNPDEVLPATTYSRTIDGIFQDGLYFTEEDFGKPPEPEIQKKLLKGIKRAKKYGLKVFVMDYSKDKKSILASWRANRKAGHVSFVAPSSAPLIHQLPRYPHRPFSENPLNALSLENVKNFVYIGNSFPMGRQDEFAMKMHNTNYDMIFLNNFHGRSPLSRQAIETLKYKKMGSKRLVMAVIDIATAASHSYFWEDGWQTGSPYWISEPFYNDPDKFHIEYWQPEWQQIISGDTDSYIYGLIAQGFDGVLLEGLDSYRFYEDPMSEADAAERYFLKQLTEEN